MVDQILFVVLKVFREAKMADKNRQIVIEWSKNGTAPHVLTEADDLDIVYIDHDAKVCAGADVSVVPRRAIGAAVNDAVTAGYSDER